MGIIMSNKTAKQTTTKTVKSSSVVGKLIEVLMVKTGIKSDPEATFGQ
jgi:hypothetical protein